MPIRVSSSGVVGVESHPIWVEVDVASGAFGFDIVGLPDAAVRESRQRVKSALRNAGFEVPRERVIVNLSPADLKKEGTAYDLPIALGILVASKQLRRDAIESAVVIGELGLSGAIRPVRGILAAAMTARGGHFGRMIVPMHNAAEASAVPDIDVIAASTLRRLVDVLEGSQEPEPWPAPAAPGKRQEPPNIGAVRGQSHGRRAVEVCAAGGHSLLMSGPPGAGKTMLARCLHGLLPPMGISERLEVSRIYSVAGLLPGGGLMERRPFRAPHHTSSAAAIVGGGPGLPRPGEVTLAHNGVLFLDELPEFPRNVREVLRQPMEAGSVRIARARGTVRFPAQFQLIATMNPCPCGYYGVKTGPRRCRCNYGAPERYAQRLSGPLRDRFDVAVAVEAVAPEELLARGTGEDSATVRPRVVVARERQWQRYEGKPWQSNAAVPGESVEETIALDAPGRRLALEAMNSLGLSARGYHRALRVARTIADLASSPKVQVPHLAEALSFKGTPT